MILTPSQGSIILLQNPESIEFFIAAEDFGSAEHVILPLNWQDVDAFLTSTTNRRQDIKTLEIWINIPRASLVPSILVEENQARKLSKYIFTRDVDLANIHQKISSEYHLTFQVPVELISLSWDHLQCQQPRHLFELLVAYSQKENENVNKRVFIWPHEKHFYFVYINNQGIQLANAYDAELAEDVKQIFDRVTSSLVLNPSEFSITGIDLPYALQCLFNKQGLECKNLPVDILFDPHHTA